MFVKEQLPKIIEEGGYTQDQIFNVDETGLYWKRMPDRTYIAKEEKTQSGYKAAKDRVTLLLGGNASGNCKLMPLFIHRSENPRALKNVPKESLPVIYKWNSKAWVNLKVFDDWFKNYFIPEVKTYCQENDIPFKILLLLDNAPGHPINLNLHNPNVNVVFMPSNTTSLIQPMDQGVIVTFKRFYLRETFKQAIHDIDSDKAKKTTLKDFWSNFSIYNAIENVDTAWNEMKKKTMKKTWKNLCPQFFVEEKENNDPKSTSNKEQDDEENQEVIQNILSLGKQLDLPLDEIDIHELVASHAEELSNEDLLDSMSMKKNLTITPIFQRDKF